VPGIASDRCAVAAYKRAVVLHQPFQSFPRKVETVETGVAMLKIGDDAQRMGVVIEATKA
jgi:hypothetical protein